MSLTQTGHRSRGSYGSIAFQVLRIHYTSPAEAADSRFTGKLEHIGFGVQRSAHWKADNSALFAHLEYHVPAAADATGCRFHNANSEAGRDGSVNSVAALFQHFQACLSRVDVLSSDHAIR
jgi:hypothetical protein